MLRRSPSALVACLCLCSVLLAADASGVWLDVPFVKQQKDGCGSASVAMVMQYWLQQAGQAAGESADPQHIQRALYSSRAHGIYASDLGRYLQQQGFQTFVFRGTWTDLRQQLLKGRPLIVGLGTTAGSGPLHYVVVTGLDWQLHLVLVNDPAERKLLKRDRSSFEKQWQTAGNWVLLAVPQTAGR